MAESEGKKSLSGKEIKTKLEALTKGEENAKLNMEIVMRPYANWGQFLSPAPLSIALLGELMLIASETDFSLAKNPPAGGFKQMKHPSSFRTSLLQVSNTAYEAFSEANSSMDQIRIRTLAIPSEVKHALEIIIAGTNQEIKDIVPKKLQRIKEGSDKCLLWAQNTEAKFETVMMLTAEILEACTKTEGEHDKELLTTLTAIQHMRERVHHYHEEQRNSQKDLQELKADIQNAHKRIEDAMDKIPGAIQATALSAISMVTSGLTHKFCGIPSCVVTVASQLGPQVLQMAKEVAMEHTPIPVPSLAPTAMEKADRNIYTKNGNILMYVTMLSSLIIESNQDGDQQAPTGKLKLSENVRSADRGSRFVKLEFQTLLEEVRKESDASDGVRDLAADMCKKGADIAQSLTSLYGDMDQHQDEIQEINKRVKQLQKDAKMFQTAAMKKLAAPPIPSTTPQQNEAQENCSIAAGQNALIASIEAGRFKTEQAMGLLKNAEQRHDRLAKEMEKKNIAAMELMEEISRHDIRKLDLETIRSTLYRGMKALASIRDQWAKLVEFFKMMSNIMECALTVSLAEFIDTVDGGRSVKKVGALTLSHAVRDVLFEEAYMAIRISHLVNMLSTTYYEVSKDHIMGRIGILHQIVAMDPRTQSEDMKYWQRQLLEQCQEAQRKIQEHAQASAKKFHATIQKRIDYIEHDIIAQFPPPTSPEESAAIEQERADIQEAIARAESETLVEDLDDWV